MEEALPTGLECRPDKEKEQQQDQKQNNNKKKDLPDNVPREWTNT